MQLWLRESAYLHNLAVGSVFPTDCIVRVITGAAEAAMLDVLAL